MDLLKDMRHCVGEEHVLIFMSACVLDVGRGKLDTLRVCSPSDSPVLMMFALGKICLKLIMVFSHNSAVLHKGN